MRNQAALLADRQKMSGLDSLSILQRADHLDPLKSPRDLQSLQRPGPFSSNALTGSRNARANYHSTAGTAL